MTIMIKPKFIDSTYFVPEFNNWHLKPDAPEEVIKEFNEWTEIHEELQTLGKKEKNS